MWRGDWGEGGIKRFVKKGLKEAENGWEHKPLITRGCFNVCLPRIRQKARLGFALVLKRWCRDVCSATPRADETAAGRNSWGQLVQGPFFKLDICWWWQWLPVLIVVSARSLVTESGGSEGERQAGGVWENNRRDFDVTSYERERESNAKIFFWWMKVALASASAACCHC